MQFKKTTLNGSGHTVNYSLSSYLNSSSVFVKKYINKNGYIILLPGIALNSDSFFRKQCINIKGDVPRSNKQQYQKTDKLNCRSLCKQLQQEQLHGIYIPTEPEEQLKSLLRQRNQEVKQLRRAKSHIKIVPN